MATPDIVASTRFTSQGTTKCYFLPTIAAGNLTPTRPEMDAGTNLSPQLNDWSGWTVTSNKISTPDLETTFESSIPGKTSSEDSDITFYASLDGADVRTLLPRGTTGFIMFCDGGDVPGNKADVYPIQVMSNGKVRSVNGEDADKITVPFSITAEPAENVTIPA
jgi:hypothetical protein